MTKTELITYFGSQHAISRLFSIRQATISEWPEEDVPGDWQLIIERYTLGQLQAAPSCYLDVVARVHAATRGLIRMTEEEVKRHIKKLQIKVQLVD